MANEKEEEICKKIGEINNSLTNLKLIYDYLNYFFKDSQKANIEKIDSMIASIKDGPLYYYDKNC